MPYKLTTDIDTPALETENEHRALVDWLPMHEVRLLPDYLWFGDSEKWVWEGDRLRGDNTSIAFSANGGTPIATVKMEDDPTTFTWTTKLRPTDIEQIQNAASDYEASDVTKVKVARSVTARIIDVDPNP